MKCLVLTPMLALLASSLPSQESTEPQKPASTEKSEKQGAAEPRQFMRFVENDEGGFLQVMVGTYQKGNCTLKLYGCVHVADRAFYQGMEKAFAKHDALLYELIAEPDVRPYPEMETDGDHWISMVQDGMGSGLALQSQFECMDYRQKNYVHADMTDEEWMEALNEAGKSELGELMAGGFTEPDREAEAKQKPIDLVAAFRSGQGISQLRIMMGRVLCSSEGQPDQPTVIIHGRNEKCLAVLQKQLDAGKKDLGIFYGAAHMEHMEQRLLKDLGWKLVKDEWVNAWDCRHASFPKVEKGLKRKRYRARRDIGKLLKAVEQWCDEHAGGKPSWEKLRKASKDGKLPGRADGKDPWGRDYVLLPLEGGFEVRSTASDGELGTEDDVVDAVRFGGKDDELLGQPRKSNSWLSRYQELRRQQERYKQLLVEHRKALVAESDRAAARIRELENQGAEDPGSLEGQLKEAELTTLEALVQTRKLFDEASRERGQKDLPVKEQLAADIRELRKLAREANRVSSQVFEDARKAYAEAERERAAKQKAAKKRESKAAPNSTKVPR